MIANGHDTIAAIATPLGDGAIAVIRVSGNSAITAIGSLFSGKAGLDSAAGYTAHFGKLISLSGEHIDDVIITVFRKPQSYTGENSVEVSCHGGLYITQRVFETILSSGIRQAEPGEFTKRAFLNGKMDLSQAEAVAGIIAARSESSLKASLAQLEGKFSGQIAQLRGEMMNLRSLLELELDFSEEGLDLISKSDILFRFDSLLLKLTKMMDSYRLGRISREGVAVAIVGKPNAGKSSLFNALLREERAIVTEVPGTTRDFLEESLSVDGILVRLTDTAGIRETFDLVEAEGVARTAELTKHADVLVLVVDSSHGPNRDEAITLLKKIRGPGSVIVAYNKSDLYGEQVLPENSFGYGEVFVKEVFVSAKTGAGLDRLRKSLLETFSSVGSNDGGVMVVSSRHHSAIARSIGLLTNGRNAIECGVSREFIAFDVGAAGEALAEIVGELSTDDILDNIFHHFCIGK